MSVDITVGSIVFGKSGKPLQVIAIEGDVLRVSGESGYMKVRRTAILKVEPPISVRQPHRPTSFNLGDRVKYIGSDFNLKKQYAGILEVWEISNSPFDGYTCLKSNGRLTSWIHFEDLELEVAQ
jgi:hypothetical protein